MIVSSKKQILIGLVCFVAKTARMIFSTSSSIIAIRFKNFYPMSIL